MLITRRRCFGRGPKRIAASLETASAVGGLARAGGSGGNDAEGDKDAAPPPASSGAERRIFWASS
eukprot:3493320-Lingulodinium_polyedra.AAC.1